MTRSLRILTPLCALLLFVALGATQASAHTYRHGLNVWFTDKTIGDGDVVRGDVDVVFGTLSCEDGAEIQGNVRTYFGDFNPSDSCQVDGRVVNAFDGDDLGFAPWMNVGMHDALAENRKFFEKLAWDLVVVLVFLLFPLRARIALERVEHRPGLSAAAGLIAMIAVLPIAVILALTIVGIPLIVIEFAALLAAVWIGHAAVALLVGRRLYELIRPHATPTPLGALILGLIVVSAAQTLPVVGWAVSCVVWVVGLGAAVLAFVRETAFQNMVGAGPAGPPPPGVVPPNVPAKPA